MDTTFSREASLTLGRQDRPRGRQGGVGGHFGVLRVKGDTGEV